MKMQGFYVCVVIFVFCLFQHTNGYCCFRDPLMLKSKCGCPDDTPCGIIKCPTTCNTGTKACGCSKPACSNIGSQYVCGYPAYPISSSFCDCGLPCCSSYRDTSNVCFVCDNPSPICSCLKNVNDFDCGCEELRSFIYFPEVEYPILAMEMKPFYYSSCYSY